ncbi:MAG: mandelate racemase/muconate lactonizing enzyme family protein [Planctomycetes bacterium]|nr:mandelate racemase/muconate lactonizing enzyme family protein [Planctomycetota bacterium]
MKITGIEVHPVQAPGRTLVVILVKTDEGLTGVGEAGLQRRWKAIEGAVEHLKRWLIGEDPMRIEHLWQRMSRGGFYPADRLIGSAISGIDIALWDIKGQALGVPVYELLGGRCRDHVECFFQPGYLTSAAAHPRAASHPRETGAAPEDPAAEASEAAAAARRYVEEGYRYFRIAPSPGKGAFRPRDAARRAIAQLRAVREAVGHAVELMVDLHTRLDPPEAVRFCLECEPLDVFVVEDPIRSEHPAGYRRIRRQTRVPLAAGEQWASKWEFRAAIEEELIDYARVDLCIAGGLTEGRKIAAMAEAHLVKLLLHNPLGPVCTAASLQLDLACDNAGPQEVLWPPQSMLPDVFQCDFAMERGRLTAPASAGLGVRFDAEAAKAHPAEMTEPPHWRRDDGSFTNY